MALLRQLILPVLALCGCDRLFDLQHISETDDSDGGVDKSDGVRDAPSAHCSGTATLADDFNDNNLNTNVWFTWSVAGATAREENQEVVLDLGPDNVENARQAEIVSLSAFDLVGRELTVEVTRISNRSMKLQAVLFVRDDSNGNILVVASEQDTLFCGMRKNGAYSQLTLAIPYEPGAHRFWSIREAGGNVHLAVSADAGLWNELTSLTTPFDVSAVKVGMYVYMDGAGFDPGLATFDNLVLCESP